MISSGLLARIVELTGTYLLHSTLFLLATWGLLSLYMGCCVRGNASPQSDESVSPEMNPLLVERAWKFAALLGLLTAPISLVAGLSPPFIHWPPDKVSSIDADSQRPNRTHRPVVVTPGKQMSTLPPDVSMESDVLKSAGQDLPDSLRTSAVSWDELELRRPPPLSTGLQHERAAIAPSVAATEKATATPGSLDLDFNPGKSVRLSGWTGRQRSVDWAGWVCIIWLTWSSCRLVARRIWLWRMLSRCEPLAGTVNAQLKPLTPPGATIRLLQARTAFSAGQDSVGGPFACGMFRWTIVIPEWLERELSADEIKALLAHEVAHLVRSDAWWQFVGEILCSCLACQPLNRLARSRWQQAAELLCDDWAVRHEATPLSLATCLTRIAARRLPAAVSIPGLAAVAGTGQLTRRIQWLLRTDRAKESPSRFAPRVISVLSLISAICVSAFGPHVSLVQSAELNQTQREQHILAEINTDFRATERKLESMKEQLTPGNELRAQIESLLRRTSSLNLRIQEESQGRVAAP